jgi:uncharacterized protein (DUF1015 family)
MVEIFPFQGVRYTPTHDLAQVTAPPYDVITPEMRTELLARSPENVVSITLGPQEQNSAEWYRQAGATKARWLQDGTWRRDPVPALYGYRQEFETPAGAKLARTGFLARVKLAPWGQGIHRHEFTRQGPKADRLALMHATHMNLSAVFGLYRDPQFEIAPLLALPSQCDADFAVDGVRHTLWRITDQTVIDRIVTAMAQRDVVIADGHHRYETALAYRDACRAAIPKGQAAACDHVLMFLDAAEDPGLVILPTHRVVTGSPQALPAGLLCGLNQDFELLSVETDIPLQQAIVGDATTTRIGALLADGSRWLLRLRNPERARQAAAGQVPEVLASLDVVVLQTLVLDPLFGITPEVLASGSRVTYTISEPWAEAQVRSGQAQAAFILNATTLSQTWDAALAGVTMPQKSTYFTPKLQTGLVFNPLDEL